MEQLRMLWKPENVAPADYSVDGRFEIRAMNYDEIDKWCETGKELSGNLWSREQFIEQMLFVPPLTLSPKHIFCAFEKASGAMVATASACLDGVNHIGELHRVSAKAEYKGLGLGKAVCAEAVRCFRENRCTVANLLTDDFRKPAIAIYLKLGFRPYLYTGDMKERWTTVLNDMQWRTDVLAFDKDRDDIFLFPAADRCCLK